MDREKIELYVDLLMIALAVFTVFLLFYELTITTGQITADIVRKVRAIHWLDFWICWIFIAEFVVRTWKEEDRKGFVKSHLLEIPGMIPFTVFGVASVFRVFRLFRLVRLVTMTKRFSKLYQKRFVKNEIQYVAIIVITILLFSSYGILLFERRVNPDIKTVGDAFWWSVVTVTTVGYGDKVPITPMGRAIGVMLMFTGIGLIGTFSGFMASYLVRGFKAEKEAEDIEEALRVLKLRRARGEVTEEQYKEIKTDLERMLKEK